MTGESKSHGRAATSAAFLMNVAMGAYFLSGPLFVLKRLNATSAQLGFLGAACSLCYMITAIFTGHVLGWINGRIRAVAGAAILVLAAVLSAAAEHQFLVFVGIFSLGSAGAAIFWTGLESVLIHPEIGIMESSRKFNMAWSLGYIFGSLIAGGLARRSITVAFGAVAALALVCAVSSALIPTASSEPDREIPKEDWETAGPETAGMFLYLAFAANLLFWVTSGVMRYIFPQIGLSIGFTETGISIILSLWAAAQAFGYHTLGTWRRWTYNFRWLFGAQAVVIISLCALGLLPTKALHAVVYIIVGASGCIPYTSALVYSLADRKRSMVLVGYHEALISLGSFIGSLLGGWSSIIRPISGPYFACAILLTTGLLVQLAVIKLRK